MRKEEKIMDDKEYEKELKDNPPIMVESLPLRPGELVFTDMPEGDKFQLLIRYLNDVATFNKNQTILLAQLTQLVKYVCEHLGIDVQAKEKETTRKFQEQIEKNIKESKEKLVAGK
jgi:hypothetical protein